MVCHPSHAARSSFSFRDSARIRVMSSMFLHVSGLDGSGHHLPLPYMDSRLAMIFDSSSDSFGSAGGAITSATLSSVSWRRWSGGASTLSNLVASFANLARASENSWLARALIASVSSVMKVCWTQPAWPCATPSFSTVAFTLSRNVLASAGVAEPDDVEAVGAHAAAAAHSSTPATDRNERHVISADRS